MSDGSVIETSLDGADEKMARAVEVASEDFAGIRTGRASPALVEKLKVDYYGTETPLVQIAQISAPEPRLLTISPYDKNAISAIEKAIQSSNLGLVPSNDGSLIRLSIPALTEERRKELVKMVHARAEEARVAVRNTRRHAKDELEKAQKAGELSEDELRRAEKELQEITDRHIKEVDEMLARKESELLEV